MEQKLCEGDYQNLRGDHETISQLESKIEEQKQLRLQDARQVEVKAGVINLRLIR